MSNNIEQFLEVFISYSALSLNSPKVIEKKKDGTMVSKALIKFPVNQIDYHDTMVYMLDDEKYEMLKNYFQLSNIDVEKELFYQLLSKIAKKENLHVLTNRNSNHLYIEISLDQAKKIYQKFHTDIIDSIMQSKSKLEMVKQLDEKMGCFVEFFQLQNYLDRIFRPSKKNKVKSLQMQKH